MADVASTLTWPPGVAVRATCADDRPLLQRYFEHLPAADRRLRFFGPSRPDAHLTRWLALADHGGATFLATTTVPDGRLRCVGEAGFAPRGDGTAEFALSVAPDARGGLGSRLLELLRRAADERGIAALHGDVRVDNGAMRHLLRRLGAITVDRPEADAVSLVVASGSGLPPWSDLRSRRLRVLVEAADGRWPGEERLRRDGHQVAVCPGPAGRPTDDPCPLLVGRSCPLVDGADVVVQDLQRGGDAERLLAAAHERGTAARLRFRRGYDAPGVSGAQVAAAMTAAPT